MIDFVPVHPGALLNRRLETLGLDVWSLTSDALVGATLEMCMALSEEPCDEQPSEFFGEVLSLFLDDVFDEEPGFWLSVEKRYLRFLKGE